jgi:hypothetical protein
MCGIICSPAFITGVHPASYTSCVRANLFARASLHVVAFARTQFRPLNTWLCGLPSDLLVLFARYANNAWVRRETRCLVWLPRAAFADYKYDSIRPSSWTFQGVYASSMCQSFDYFRLITFAETIFLVMLMFIIFCWLHIAFNENKNCLIWIVCHKSDNTMIHIRDIFINTFRCILFSYFAA